MPIPDTDARFIHDPIRPWGFPRSFDPLSRGVLWHGFWGEGFANSRYSELLPRLTTLFFAPIQLRAGWRGRLETGLWRRMPWLEVMTLRRYRQRGVRTLLTADPMQASRFEGPVVVDLDDPTYSDQEQRALRGRNIAAIVVPTSDVHDAVRRFASPPSLAVIPQGVDLRRAHRGRRDVMRRLILDQLNLSDDVPIVGYHAPLLYSSCDASVSRGNNQAYNVDVLLWGITELWSDGINFVTVMLGEPSESLSRAASRERRLVLPGYIQRSELFDWVSAFDIGTYPRLVDFQGRQSVKVLEYFACGAPVVATDVSESRIVRDSDAGLVCAAREDFADALRLLILDNKLRTEIGGRARQVVTSYDWDDLARKYDDFLVDVLSRFE